MGHWSHIIYGTNDQVFYSSAKTRKNKDIKNMKWQNNTWADTNFNFEIEKRQKHLGKVPTERLSILYEDFSENGR